jgi:hypothetical protein
MKTGSLYIILFFDNRIVYEISWKNTVEQQSDKSQMTVWRMRIVCWLFKAANTHSDDLSVDNSPGVSTKDNQCRSMDSILRIS